MGFGGHKHTEEARRRIGAAKKGVILQPSRPAMERFLERVEPRGECLIWTARTLQFSTGPRGKNQLARRWIYQYVTGKSLEKTLHLAPSCGDWRCVNVSHMVPLHMPTQKKAVAVARTKPKVKRYDPFEGERPDKGAPFDPDAAEVAYALAGGADYKAFRRARVLDLMERIGPLETGMLAVGHAIK